MSYKCPNCDSSQTASIQVARSRETQTGKFGGVGVSLGGDVGAVGGMTSSTTTFGRSLAPRAMIADKRNQIVPAAIIVIGLLGTFATWFTYAESKPSGAAKALTMAILLTAFLLAGFAWFIANTIHNMKAETIEAGYQARENAKWSKMWVCYQCGNKFEPAK